MNDLTTNEQIIMINEYLALDIADAKWTQLMTQYKRILLARKMGENE